eukprot:TRINITY_DN5674_c0_g1_i3.p2 TRINITY_DN5674_c0_g1~~TRINITY_DN5674_c0_g1_i3.p2  ORF type:complete len:228 (-),score=55.54 TRINITY_DN5674_c0_g1_i3:142-825(-)
MKSAFRKWTAEERVALYGTQECTPEHISALLSEDVLAPRWWQRHGTGRFGDDYEEHCCVFWNAERLYKVDAGNEWLHDKPGHPETHVGGASFPRIITWAVFSTPECFKLAVINTHLDWASHAAREKSVSTILNMARLLQDKWHCPVVLMGDMNSSKDDNVYRALTREGFRDAWNDATCKDDGHWNRTYHDYGVGWRGGDDLSGREHIDWVLATARRSQGACGSGQCA